jgi:hypothetical protein
VCLHYLRLELEFGTCRCYRTQWRTLDFMTFIAFSVCRCREAPQLTALLKEMKEGLDAVRSKIEGLTTKVGIL